MRKEQYHSMNMRITSHPKMAIIPSNGLTFSETAAIMNKLPFQKECPNIAKRIANMGDLGILQPEPTCLIHHIGKSAVTALL